MLKTKHKNTLKNPKCSLCDQEQDKVPLLLQVAFGIKIEALTSITRQREGKV